MEKYCCKYNSCTAVMRLKISRNVSGHPRGMSKWPLQQASTRHLPWVWWKRHHFIQARKSTNTHLNFRPNTKATENAVFLWFKTLVSLGCFNELIVQWDIFRLAWVICDCNTCYCGTPICLIYSSFTLPCLCLDSVLPFQLFQTDRENSTSIHAAC